MLPSELPIVPCRMCHKLKKSFVRTSPGNEKIPQVSSGKKMEPVGFSMPHSLNFEIHALLENGERSKRNHDFAMPLCIGNILGCPAPGVRDIRNHEVGVLKHPIVPPGDRIARMNVFNPLRQHGVRIIFVFTGLLGHVCKHNCVRDCRILRPKCSAHISIKLPLITDIKHADIFMDDQILDGLFKQRLDCIGAVTVPKECTRFRFSSSPCSEISLFYHICIY